MGISILIGLAILARRLWASDLRAATAGLIALRLEAAS